jgi:hypothetical protein
MNYAKTVRRVPREKETVDCCLDRLMDTIRRELEKGSPDDYRKLMERRKRRERRRRGNA